MLKRLEKFKAAFSSKSNGLKDEDAGGKDGEPEWMGVQLKFAPDPVKVIFTSLCTLYCQLECGLRSN